MTQEILVKIYNCWISSPEYAIESTLESGVYDTELEKMKDIVGKEQFNKIEDNIMHVACETEYAAFYSGFRYGVKFLTELLKGGVAHAE